MFLINSAFDNVSLTKKTVQLVGEKCGGPYDESGVCDTYLICYIDDPLNAIGTCGLPKEPVIVDIYMHN